jgi:hypothetical protein
VDLGGRLGMRRLMTSGGRVPKLDDQLKKELSQRYLDEFEALEGSLGIDLSSWRG